MIPATKPIDDVVCQTITALHAARAALSGNQQMKARQRIREAIANLQDLMDADDLWGRE